MHDTISAEHLPSFPQFDPDKARTKHIHLHICSCTGPIPNPKLSPLNLNIDAVHVGVKTRGQCEGMFQSTRHV